MVNMGTIAIVLDGEPRELLYSLGTHDRVRGKYTYSYSYAREKGNEAYTRPLNWFRARKSKAAAALKDRTFNVDTGTTSEKDGSRVVIEINRRRVDD